MKAIILLFLSAIVLLIAPIAFADGALFPRENRCHTCHRESRCNTCNGGCSTCVAEDGPQYGCKCADRGMYYNDCIDRRSYCKAFGNIGAMDD